MNIDDNRNIFDIDIVKIENHYNSKFVGAFTYKGRTVLGFYNPTPDRDKGHSEYFIMYSEEGKAYIANGEWLKDLTFQGIRLPSGKIIYSYHRHHYNKQEGYYVDGGFEYMRTNSDDIVTLCIKDGNIVQSEISDQNIVGNPFGIRETTC